MTQRRSAVTPVVDAPIIDGQAGTVEGPAFLYLADYSRDWPAQFAELEARLRAALRGLSVEIEHVGSTSVPGLVAKPMIDIDVVVPKAADVPVAVERLERAGYRAKGTRGVPGREAFDQPPGGPVHALYVVVTGSKPHLDHVLLRDLLRRRPDLAARYESVKRANADRLPADRLGYTDAKADLITELLVLARTDASLPLDPGAVDENGVVYRWRASIDDGEVVALHADAFDETPGRYQWRRSRPLSLGWVSASEGDRLVGFANVAWDGADHAFLLDVAVASDRQHRGIGRSVVNRALEEAHKADCRWVHVDYEQHLTGFYAACGFTPTAAGLRKVN
ncbi:MAG: GNAT family N-acetyltransferase [Acidimicrobiales bacterium]